MGCLPFDSYLEVAFWFLLGVLVMAVIVAYDSNRYPDDKD